MWLGSSLPLVQPLLHLSGGGLCLQLQAFRHCFPFEGLGHPGPEGDIPNDGDETIIYHSALALDVLQKIYGQYPRRLPCSQNCFALSPTPIDSLIILDRRGGMITPLLTQLTYEGLIDEVITIKNSHVELPMSLLNPPPAPNQGPSQAFTSTAATSIIGERTKKYHLSAVTDPLLTDLRDPNFLSVGKRLSQTAHRLDEEFNVGQLYVSGPTSSRRGSQLY
ncbi:hypothetical protein PISMIDRAFT_642810 [Pisolithus microcarpus 441]|uniref:Uncharacterized protein n=1 Tax=Pisolithus microcarpus 441 TaxID=765257 RepID=A0A0C9YBZ6_9AGAM|nr:hypothetical protein PISMIDRAFT_642810 [Pisolithus microcarpus 441]